VRIAVVSVTFCKEHSGDRTVVLDQPAARDKRVQQAHGFHEFFRCLVVDPVSAIVNCDFEAAEALRGSLGRQQVSDIVALYRDTSDWGQKDIAVHLLQDCEPSAVEVVMRDALNSPTTETRAIAFCSLKNDFGMFENFLRDGFVDAALVDDAIHSEFGT